MDMVKIIYIVSESHRIQDAVFMNANWITASVQNCHAGGGRLQIYSPLNKISQIQKLQNQPAVNKGYV